MSSQTRNISGIRLCEYCNAPLERKVSTSEKNGLEQISNFIKRRFCDSRCATRHTRRNGHKESVHCKKTPEYIAWLSMKARCYYAKHVGYSRYGGRGITVCPEWKNSYVTFLRAVGRRPGPEYSLDRYPNKNGNYEPGNVRWATPIDQNRNARSNHLITFKGKTQSLAGWAEEVGLPRHVLSLRIMARKWPIEKALTTPKAARSGIGQGRRVR